MRFLRIVAVLIATCLTATSSGAEPGVRIVLVGGKHQLERNSEPYFIRGVGGNGPQPLLVSLGGNSVRTWGAEGLGETLDKAHALGLTVSAGIWLGQVRQGFDWSDAASLIKQRETVRAVIEKHRNHPALLMWSLGNEMEDGEGKNGAVWSEINNLARLVKSVDAGHPTMTVIAELGGDKVKNLHALCPDIDVVGINSYAGGPSVAERYKKQGGTKPYVLTEFGPPGIWEIGKDEIDAYPEQTSTAKAAAYRATYQQSVLGEPNLCLGSYAFLWGEKQEVTATWFSILSGDSRLAAADTLSELWTSKPVANRCPVIESLTCMGSRQRKPGETVQVALKTSDPEQDELSVTWQFRFDAEQYGTGGDAEAAALAIDAAIVKKSNIAAEIKLPEDGGLYRLFAIVKDKQGGAAVANIAIRVDAPRKTLAARKAELPLVLYSEPETAQTYIPAGWMGDVKAIKLDPEHADKPHAGKTCLRCDFTAKEGWGGVVWQSPEQDWGDRPGGFDLTGAKRVKFWARGASGGEKVTFSFGLLEKPKPYFDTGKGSVETVLAADWKEYEIPLDKLDLTRIKTGFVWTLASNGEPITFYLDDVRWE